MEIAAARPQFTREVTPMIVVFVVAPGLLKGRGRGRLVLEGPGLLFGFDQHSDD